jgi:hypothetical protein
MVRGVASWAALPGSALPAVGVRFGIIAQRGQDVSFSRRHGAFAALRTTIGLIEVAVVLVLT